MKIRNGFVSNSSSSSYIIAVKSGSECEKESALLFEFFINSLKEYRDDDDRDSHLQNRFNGSAEDYISLLQTEYEDIQKDIDWARQEITDLSKVIENEDAINLFAHWKKRYGSPNYSLRYARYFDEDEEKEPTWNYDYLKGEIRSIKNRIKCEEEKIIEMKDKIDKLSSLNEDDKIYAIKIDNWDHNRDLFKKILNIPWITIVEKNHT